MNKSEGFYQFLSRYYYHYNNDIYISETKLIQFCEKYFVPKKINNIRSIFNDYGFSGLMDKIIDDIPSDLKGEYPEYFIIDTISKYIVIQFKMINSVSIWDHLTLYKKKLSQIDIEINEDDFRDIAIMYFNTINTINIDELIQHQIDIIKCFISINRRNQNKEIEVLGEKILVPSYIQSPFPIILNLYLLGRPDFSPDLYINILNWVKLENDIIETPVKWSESEFHRFSLWLWNHYLTKEKIYGPPKDLKKFYLKFLHKANKINNTFGSYNFDPEKLGNNNKGAWNQWKRSRETSNKYKLARL